MGQMTTKDWLDGIQTGLVKKLTECLCPVYVLQHFRLSFLCIQFPFFRLARRRFSRGCWGKVGSFACMRSKKSEYVVFIFRVLFPVFAVRMF